MLESQKQKYKIEGRMKILSFLPFWQNNLDFQNDWTPELWLNILTISLGFFFVAYVFLLLKRIHRHHPDFFKYFSLISVLCLTFGAVDRIVQNNVNYPINQLGKARVFGELDNNENNQIIIQDFLADDFEKLQELFTKYDIYLDSDGNLKGDLNLTQKGLKIKTGAVNSRSIEDGSIQDKDIDSKTNLHINQIITKNSIEIGGQASFQEGINVSGDIDFSGGLSVSNIDLGTNTLSDGVFDGDWDFNNGNVNIRGDLTVGTSSINRLTLNGSLSSHIVPSVNTTYDLGSPAYYYRNVYAGTVIANNISAAGTNISGTSAETLAINSDNITSDGEDSYLIFTRGTITPNALLWWDSTLDTFKTNQDLFIQDETPTTGSTLLTIKAGTGQGTDDLTQWRDGSGNLLASLSSVGGLTLGSNLILGSNTLTTSNTTLVSNLNADLLDGQEGAYYAPLANLSGTTNYLSKFTGTNSIGNSLIYDDGTNVGIGTSSPGAKLEVSGTTGASVILNNSGGSGWFRFNEAGSVRGYLGYGDGGSIFNDALTDSLSLRSENALHLGSGSVVDLTIATDGNVGIGTTSPSEKLEINGNIITTPQRSLPHLIIDSTASGDNWTDQGAYISIGESTSNAASMHMSYRGDGYGFIGAGLLTSGEPAGGFWRFYYDSSTIYSDADVTANSFNLTGGANFVNYSGGWRTSDIFYVDDSSSATYLYSDNTYLGATSGDTIQVRGNVMTGNSWYMESDGLRLGSASSPGSWQLYIDGEAYATDFIAAAGGMHVGGSSDPGTDNLVVDGTTKTGSVYSHTGSSLNFYADGNITAYVDQDDPGETTDGYFIVRGSSGGNIFYAQENKGIWSSTFVTSGSATLCWDGSGSSWVTDCASAREFKDNIVDMSLGLSDVLKLKPREFNWKDSGLQDIGFIADEVEEVSALLPTYREGEARGVKYRHMVALLTKAIQDQHSNFQTQKNWEEEQIGSLNIKLDETDESLLEKITLAQLEIDQTIEEVNSLNNLFETIENQMTQLESKFNLNTTKIQINSLKLAYLESLLGIEIASEGDVEILGKVKGVSIEAGEIIISNAEEESKKIGKAAVSPVLKDDDDDGIDDETKSDGTSIEVKTSAVNEESRIFVTPLCDDPILWTVKNIEFQKGFEIVLEKPTNKEVVFNWMIVTEK